VPSTQHERTLRPELFERSRVFEAIGPLVHPKMLRPTGRRINRALSVTAWV
jgi:hypothetical protein